MANEMDKKIELLDEKGNPVKFSIVADFRIEGDEDTIQKYYGNEYAVLIADGDEDADEAVLFKVIEDENGTEPLFELVDDDEEFSIVSEFYNYLMQNN